MHSVPRLDTIGTIFLLRSKDHDRKNQNIEMWNSKMWKKWKKENVKKNDNKKIKKVKRMNIRSMEKKLL